MRADHEPKPNECVFKKIQYLLCFNYQVELMDYVCQSEFMFLL
jgi:hypothetical protein